VPSYLEAAMDAFQRNQNAVKDAFSGNVFADMAKRNMAMFEDAAQAFTGKAKAEPRSRTGASSSPNATDLEQLKAELAALQAKVDRLSR
jgi:polyhydroxyalkanoate synthesis regulator protein